MVGVSVPRRRARRRRWWWLAAAVVLLAAVAVALLARRGGAPPQRVYVEAVERGTFLREVSGTGTIEPLRRRDLTFPSAGTVAEVFVDEGQRVASGDALARLDTRSLERDLASNRASLASAQADLERVKAQQSVDRLDAQTAVSAAENALARAGQELDDARQRSDATERLFQAGGASLNERDAALVAVAEAERQERQALLALDAARGRMEGLQTLALAQVKSGEASVARLHTALANLQQQLAEATLTAPFTGIVASLPFQVGDAVAPAAPVAIELVDDSSVHVVADFDENRSVELAAQQRATVTPDAAPDLALPTVVTRVDPVAARGASVARVRAELAFVPDAGEALPRAALRPGYTVTARVVVRRIADALLVPLEAVGSQDGSDYVYRLRAEASGSGTVERVEVRLLDRNATLAAIAPGGLDAGDRIAVTNVDLLEDGKPVRFEASRAGG